MASVSQGFIKVCRKLNYNIAMDNFINIISRASIRRSSNDLQPSALSMLVTLSYGENWFLTHLAALLWVISIFYLMLCVGGPDWGGILNLRVN